MDDTIVDVFTRRAFLASSVLALAACSSTPGKKTGVADAAKITYGKDPSQFGELSRPKGASKGTVVVLHGGFWRAQYDLSLGRPLAADLAAHGYTAWNLEYRRVGDGGGWPATLDDVAAGIDHLSELDDVDARTVAVIGHSAGGQLAVWAAGRGTLPAGAPGAAPKVTIAGVVAQAGVLDLATAARTGVGSGAVQDFVGGSPDTVPDRYRVADPVAQVPLPVPVLCLHARDDANVPYAQSTAYVAAATKAGAKARLTTTDGDHFTLIDVSSPAWTSARDALPALLAGELPG